MHNQAKVVFTVLLFTAAQTKELELPLCPTNFQFLPQPLPMHCRMPNGKITSTFPNGLPGNVPGMPGMMPMPMGASMPMPGGMQMMPGPVPMPMSAPMPGSKLPVIVMPFYSPHKNGKTREHRRDHDRARYHRRRHSASGSAENEDSSTDTSDSESSEFWHEKHRRMNGRPSKKHGYSRRSMKNQSKKQTDHNLLTPILQYMTKDGYVIFEKKISKGEAKDWLDLSKNKNDSPKQEQQMTKKEKRHNKAEENVVKDDNDDKVGSDDTGFKIHPTRSKGKPPQKIWDIIPERKAKSKS